MVQQDSGKKLVFSKIIFSFVLLTFLPFSLLGVSSKDQLFVLLSITVSFGHRL
jgi:hypothetical protein